MPVIFTSASELTALCWCYFLMTILLWPWPFYWSSYFDWRLDWRLLMPMLLVRAPRMEWCCRLNVKLLVLLAQGTGGRAEAEALSDTSLLAESAERTGELISDTPGYYKHSESSKHWKIMIQAKTLFTPQILVSDMERPKLFLWNIASIKCEYFGFGGFATICFQK